MKKREMNQYPASTVDVYMYIHTYTHTHIYAHIYIYTSSCKQMNDEFLELNW